MPPIEDHLGRPHSPIFAIGRIEYQDEGRIPAEWCGLTINSGAHTPSHRLSALRGEKMNQFVDFANQKSPIANHKSLHHPMARSQVAKSAHRFIGSSIHRLITTLVSEGPMARSQARAGWGYTGSVYNGRRVWVA